jgi:hypothetical protein
LLPWQNPFGKGENRVSPVGARERQGFICKAIVAKKDILYRDGGNMCGSCDRKNTDGLLQNLVSPMKGKGKHYRACSGRRTGSTCGSYRSADLASLTDIHRMTSLLRLDCRFRRILAMPG